MSSNYLKPLLWIMRVHYGKGLKLNGWPVIAKKRHAKITLGDNVIINSSLLSNLVGLYGPTILCARTPHSEIVIGDNVGISGATIYARKGIYIGDNTCIGGNCKILDNDFHPLEWEIRNQLMRQRRGSDDDDRIPSLPIHIGKNCMIGCNTIILKGTVLGDGCVVGAGAVVSGKFEPNSVILGNPARCVRKLKDE